MASLQRAVKPGGRVAVLVDFRRIPGTSTDWVLNHVRAGQEVFEAEIIKSGFEKVDEEPNLLRENYFVVFQKSMADEPARQGPPWGIGRGRGPGFGRGRGPGGAMRAVRTFSIIAGTPCRYSSHGQTA